jgi:hypothetical protein
MLVIVGFENVGLSRKQHAESLRDIRGSSNSARTRNQKIEIKFA